MVKAAVARTLTVALVLPMMLGSDVAVGQEAGSELAYEFEPSGFKGGGFFTGVAMAPEPSDTIILAGGNSGYHRSTDLGASFTSHNRDLVDLPRMRIASVAYHPTRPGVVYGATGSQGRNGGFARSVDDGRTWEVLSTEPRFAGADNSGIDGLPEHPRSTGSLIVVDDDTIWVGTFRDGVMRSHDGGLTWEVIGLADLFIRSLVAHRSDPAVLFVSTWGQGVYMTDDADADAVTFREVPGAPATVEELAFVGETLYAAAGTDGLFRLDGETWTPQTGGVPAGSNWTAIAGLPTGEADLLFAGCHACSRDDAGHYATIIRSTDGGATWQSVTQPENLDFEVVGSGERWVMADGVPPYMPDAYKALVSQIVVRPMEGTGDTLVLWAGRGGMWRSTDSGETWAPAVTGLAEANSEGMAIDPADPTRVLQGAAHFGLQVSTDAFETVHVDALVGAPPIGDHSHPTAIRTAFDTSTQPSTVIIAAGDSADPVIGGVYLTTDPFSRDAWVDLGFTAALPDRQPTSIAVGHDADGTRIIVAAVFPRGGLVRKVAHGPWLPVEGTDAMTGQSPAKSDMIWLGGTPIIYFYDLGRGIYRSVDAGLTFDLVWAHPSRPQGTGGLTADAGDPGTVYVAAADGLFRLDDADSGSAESGDVSVVQMDGRKIADAYLADDGALWAVSHPTEDEPTKILLIRDPASAEPTIVELSDDTLADTMVVPETLVVTADGIVLVGGLRSGTVRGVPVSS